MNIIEKIKEKNNNISGAPPITIAFLGDSVTHGCFDCYFDERGRIQTYFDAKSAYSAHVKEMLNIMYPAAQINIINSGVSGDSARGGNTRFERDVAPYSPDLVVVSFGLNDAGGGMGKIDEYKQNLAEIFDKVATLGSECIFLTENMMCDRVSCHLTGERARGLAENLARTQNSGTLKAYFEAAKSVAAMHGVRVCDIYSVWEKMSSSGVDTTELLANKYNHPLPKLHVYTAIKLVETMFD